jgi:hypothetical protein
MTDGERSVQGQENPTWESHSEAQAQRLASLSLQEKLIWLEEAQHVVNHFARQRSGKD